MDLNVISENLSKRVREVLDNMEYATSAHIEIDWNTGEVPTLEYRIEEVVVGEVTKHERT